jgi:hypothetical protein
MVMKIRINKLPKKLVKAQVGRQIQGSLAITPSAWGGGNYDSTLAKKKANIRETLQPEKREDANLEAELGEVAYGGISGDNIPDSFKIGGKRHSQGGTPLNLPEGSFIFSDTSSMKIKDPAVLKMFDLKPKKGGFTPAEIAKKYDINSYKKILYDPNTDDLTRKTATLMIKNYIMKLGYLSIIQEGMKGFPQGMPEAAKPVLETMGYSMEQFIPEPVQEGQQEIMSQEESENEMPTEMPSGEPIASPESLYGDDAGAQQMPVNPMPMAQYGMTFGGYGMPMYPDGGVTINTSSSSNPITDKTRLQSEFERSGKATSEKVEGRTYTPIGEGVSGWGQETTESRQAQYKPSSKQFQGSQDAYIQAICKRLKSGDLKGVTVQYAIDVLRVIDPKHKKRAEWEAQLANCQNVEKKIETQFIKEDTPPDTKDCPCQDAQGNDIPGKFAKKDSNGNCLPETCDESTITKKKCKCTDPNTGEVTEFEIENEEECVCPDGYSSQVMGDTPGYSDVASRNILTQATMDTTVPRAGAVIPYRAEMPGTYEDYLAKIQNIGRSQEATQNLIQGTAGSAGEDFAKSMALSGQAAAANEQAIAGTQSRNINTGLGVAQFNAQTKNLNNAQRAEIWNAMMQGSKEDRAMETAGRNQRDQNIQAGIADAEAEMQQRALSNYMQPQYATDYKRGLPYFRNPKDFVPEKTKDPNEEIKKLQAIYGKDAKLGDLIALYKLQNAQGKKGGQFKDGGTYVMGDTIFPFMFY